MAVLPEVPGLGQREQPGVPILPAILSQSRWRTAEGFKPDAVSLTCRPKLHENYERRRVRRERRDFLTVQIECGPEVKPFYKYLG